MLGYNCILIIQRGSRFECIASRLHS